ncbi:dihydrolipoyllysine-residue succinyltransferase component of 2-oxoglutarate dehydrogenase complex, mitochondrial [Aplysia californica]|uniref:Dihydrolipoyllysine-residue succinyltransferase component of 2-oxoglutarate dehydrogenase complex, mitochondrial n=1 Tax=Aplysia californica TaxID=6500 RepID=A0ABM1AEA1_APLCA|nr:dihydrolipoyllysine-residue succinyltransferase component of 2-oxoglutarate dehydrogenase complex, mitochondrial [Aplysia californica]
MLASSRLRHISQFRRLASYRPEALQKKSLACLAACKVQGTEATASHAAVRTPITFRHEVSQSGVPCYHSRSFHTSRHLRGDEIRTVPCPNFPESVAEGDIQWDKAVGDAVEADEEVGQIETDKVNMPVQAPVAGVIEELLVESGATVTAGVNLFKLRVGAGGGAAPKPAAAAAAPPPQAEAPPAAAAAAAAPPPPPPSSSAGAIPDVAPPPARVPELPTSSTPTSAVKPKAAPSGGGVAPTHLGGSRSEQRVKMNRMRQRIAQRLKDAQNSCAMLTTFNEIDMSNIMEMRSKYKDAFLKKYNLKLGFMSAFVKATAFALQDQPVVNAVIDDLEIVYRDYVDISVAVATPKGLVVPVIRNVEAMNYADIEKTIAELGERAREGSLAIEDMDGGTFTISNGGVFGSMFGTPIINPPQSAILGMHGIFERPVAINGKVEVRPMMYVALTYDHKLIDGREAVTFLRKIKSAVEDPRTILLDL